MAKIPKRNSGSHAPKKGEKLDFVTNTPKILSKKINKNPREIPKAKLTPIPPLLLKEDMETAIMVKIKDANGKLYLLCLTNK